MFIAIFLVSKCLLTDIALKILLKGQLRFINKFHDVVAVSHPGKELKDLKKQEGVRIISLNMTRHISPIKDLVSLISMIKILFIYFWFTVCL